MIYILRLLTIVQCLAAIFVAAHESPSTNDIKYNGPSFQYLPSEKKPEADIHQATTTSLQQFPDRKNFNIIFHHKQYLQQHTELAIHNLYRSQSSSESQSKINSQEDGDLAALTRSNHGTNAQQNFVSNIESSQNNYHQKLLDQLPRKSDFEKSDFEKTQKPHLIFNQNPTGQAGYQAAINKISNIDPKSVSQPLGEKMLSFRIPEKTTVQSTIHNNNPSPSRQYLPPYEYLEPQVSEKVTTIYSPLNASTKRNPGNQYLPTTTAEEDPKISISPVYSFGNYPNNRPWNPINKDRSTGSHELYTSTTDSPLHLKNHYNAPALRHHFENNRNENEKEEETLVLNDPSDAQQNVEEPINIQRKTEIQTEEGYVYGKPATNFDGSDINPKAFEQQYKQEESPEKTNEDRRPNKFQVQKVPSVEQSGITVMASSADHGLSAPMSSSLLKKNKGSNEDEKYEKPEHQQQSILELEEYENQRNSKKTSQYHVKEIVRFPYYALDHRRTPFHKRANTEPGKPNLPQLSSDYHAAKENIENQNFGQIAKEIDMQTRGSSRHSIPSKIPHQDTTEQAIILHSNSREKHHNYEAAKDYNIQSRGKINPFSFETNQKPNFIPSKPGNKRDFRVKTEQEQRTQGNLENSQTFFQDTKENQQKPKLPAEQEFIKYFSSRENFPTSQSFPSPSSKASWQQSNGGKQSYDFSSSINEKHLILPDSYFSYPTSNPIVNEKQRAPVTKLDSSQLQPPIAISPGSQGEFSRNYFPSKETFNSSRLQIPYTKLIHSIHVDRQPTETGYSIDSGRFKDFDLQYNPHSQGQINSRGPSSLTPFSHTLNKNPGDRLKTTTDERSGATETPFDKEDPRLSSPFSYTPKQNWKNSLNEPLNENPCPGKQFDQEILRNSEHQQFLHGNPTATLQTPGSSPASNSFNSFATISNRPPSTIHNKKDLSSNRKILKQNSNFLHSMPTIRNFISKPISNVHHGPASDLTRQSFDMRFDSTNFRPVGFTNSPFSDTPYSVDSSKVMNIPDVSSSEKQKQALRLPHLVYGGPLQEPSILQS